MLKSIKFLVLVIILTIPAFWRMLRPGLFSTQDFHFFRFVEFDKCVQDGQLPCRWSPDAGLGYGEPVFNFYGQMTYAVGEIFHLLGFSLIDSFKAIFITSFLVAGIGMYFLAKRVWRSDWGALVAAVVYTDAPYRAVDVWVRGALPEALSFAIFPIIILFFERFNEKKKWRDLAGMSFFLGLLILTHNLSFVMFMVFLAPWVIFRLGKNWGMYLKVGLAFLLSLGMAAFYILPVVAEVGLTGLRVATTNGYFDFRGHFTDLRQILFSHNWGYGASVFGLEDGLSFSVGWVQWILPLILLFWLRKKKLLILVLVGWLALFLTHYQSIFIWKALEPMKYIQFPWRFLGVAVFAFALAAGATSETSQKLKRILIILVVALVMALNFSFFREDIWYRYRDTDLTTGKAWSEQTGSSIRDFWPEFGHIVPDRPAPPAYEGTKLLEKRSNWVSYEITKEQSEYIFPINYFPGWVGVYSKGGLTAMLGPLEVGTKVKLIFGNTRIRVIGNVISLVSLVALLGLCLKRK